MSMVETHLESDVAILGLPEGYGNVNASLAVSLARAEVDQQIATARAMPRSITRAVQNITTLATLDDVSAEECIYALPRAGKAIKGPSIRLAEIIASQWGNCRVGARVVHVDRIEKYVEAEGIFHDLESNTATTARVRRRLSDKKGRLINDDMIVVTGNAACAIAKRNAILGAVPKAVWRKAYDAVELVIAGDVKTLSERRDRAMKAFAVFGVKPEQIFVSLELGGLDDIGLEHISVLTGMHAALKNGEATVEELFAAPEAAGKPPVGINAKLDALAGKPTPAHDAETGEISEPRSPQGEQVTTGAEHHGSAQSEQHSSDNAASSPKDAEPAESSPAVSASGAAESPAQQPPLLETARARAMEGKRALTRWRVRLTVSENDSLRPHDKLLNDAAEAADREAAKAG